jgi:hypothetical protein
MATSSVPAPEKKVSWVWWVLGLLGAGLAVLVVGALLVSVYVARQVEVQRAGDSVEIRTPVGGLRAGKTEAADPGLPVYPGAQLTEPGAQVEITGPDDDSLAVVAAKYRTTDPIDKVDEWYRERLGKDFIREGPGVSVRKGRIFGVEVKSSDIAFIHELDDGMRVVALERKGGGVEIALVRLGRSEPL